MTSVFLSYSRKDKGFCDKLLADLGALSPPLNLIRDEESLPIGQPLHREILAGLQSAHHIVCLISRRSLTSTWVLWEIRQTLESQGSGNSSRLIPAFLDLDFLQNDAVQAAMDDLQVRQQILADRIPQLAQKNQPTDHIDVERAALRRALQELPGIIAYLRGIKAIDMSREQYAPSFRRLTRHILGEEKEPPSAKSAMKHGNVNLEERINRIKEFLLQPGGPADRQQALSEAAVQTCQCVEEFAPPKARTSLIIKSLTLCARIRDAYSVLKGNKLLAELNNIVTEIVTLLFQDLMGALA